MTKEQLDNEKNFIYFLKVMRELREKNLVTEAEYEQFTEKFKEQNPVIICRVLSENDLI